MRALGLDLGTRRVGAAVSDSAGSVATPVVTIEVGRGRRLDVAAVANLVREYEAEIVVVGLPRSLDGNEGPAAKRARAEIGRLSRALSVPVVAWDERLSTVSAQRNLREAGVGGRQSRGVVDQVAAAVILQSWLDAGRPRDHELETRNG